MYLFFRMLIALTLASVLTVGSFLQAPASAHAVVAATEAGHTGQADAGYTEEQTEAEQPVVAEQSVAESSMARGGADDAGGAEGAGVADGVEPGEAAPSGPERKTREAADATLWFTVQPRDRSVTEGEPVGVSAQYTGSEVGLGRRYIETSRDGGITWAREPGNSTFDPGGLAPGTFFAASWSSTATADHDGLLVRFVLEQGAARVASAAARVTVAPVRPAITEQVAFVGGGAPAGAQATATAAYGGTTFPVATQWQFSIDGGQTFAYVPAGIGPNGAQSIPLIIDSVTPEMDGRLYRVRFTNAVGSVWSDAATLSVASVWPDAAGQAVRGGEVELRIYSSDAPRFGVMAITAPEGTRITSARTNGANLSFLVDDEGRTAVSSRAARPWGGPGPSAWVTLQVDPGTAPGTWAEGGVARIVDDGLLTAVTSIAVEVLGAPEITQHPRDVSVVEGQGAVLSVAATGHPAPTVQWQASVDAGASWVDVDGATGVELAIDGVRLSMGGTLYRAVFTNSVGTTVTEAAALTVNPVRPVVTEHPAAVGVAPGDAAEFSAAFGGTDAETTVQWQFSTDGGATFSYVPAGVGPNGAQSIPLIVDSVTPEMDGWLYRVRFTNAAGSAWSDAARLTVAAVWPDVVGQAVAGGEVEVQIYSIDEPRAGVMEVTAPEGTRITSARSNGVNITFLISEDGRTAVSSRLVNPWGGAFPSAWVTLQVDPDAPAGAILDGGQARAMSSAGVPNMVMSIAVEVIAAPEITQHPQAVSVVEGQGAVLSAAATGHPAPAVQWQASTDAGASWADIDGATGAEFTIDDARLAMDGTLYRAVFTNSAGTAVTESARLSVREVRYLNLSVRPIVRLVDTL